MCGGGGRARTKKVSSQGQIFVKQATEGMSKLKKEKKKSDEITWPGIGVFKLLICSKRTG